jgi:hypothetical protein
MPQAPDDEHYRLLAKRMLAGAVVPFLGAGVNLCGRPAQPSPWRPGHHLPSGRELSEYLAAEMDYPYPDSGDLLRVSQYVDVSLGGGPLYETLHTAFDADYPPTPVHRLLASLPRLVRSSAVGTKAFFPLILTTNYDDALERAFTEAGEPFDLVTYIADGPERGKFQHTHPDGTVTLIAIPNEYAELRCDQRPIIAKIHGTVGRRIQDTDSYVITENHYISYLAHTDIAQLIPVNMAMRMRKSHFLFLGYSLKDWNLRVILHRLWGDAAPRFRSWAIQYGPDEIDEKSWAQRGVDVFDQRLEGYTTQLEQRLAEAAAEQATDPATPAAPR